MAMPPTIGSNIYRAFCEDVARLLAVSVREIHIFLLASFFTPALENKPFIQPMFKTIRF